MVHTVSCYLSVAITLIEIGQNSIVLFVVNTDSTDEV